MRDISNENWFVATGWNDGIAWLPPSVVDTTGALELDLGNWKEQVGTHREALQ